MTFEDAGGIMHDPRWGGRQHFYDDQHVYHTFCSGAGCHFSRSPDWDGGKPNEEKGFKCIPAIGFEKYEPLPPGYLPGYHKKGGPQRKVRHHQQAAPKPPPSPPARPNKPPVDEREDSIEELRKMKAQLDKKLARLEAHMEQSAEREILV
jgi:hypothetical protein